MLFYVLVVVFLILKIEKRFVATKLGNITLSAVLLIPLEVRIATFLAHNFQFEYHTEIIMDERAQQLGHYRDGSIIVEDYSSYSQLHLRWVIRGTWLSGD